MLPTAHVASALLAQRVLPVEPDREAAIAGALLPDVIDKTLAWVLKVAPSGRHIGHTPIAALLISAGASAVFGRKRGVALGSAYAVHLVGDLWKGGHVPWLMPLRKYNLRGQAWRADLSVQTLLLEAAGAAVVVWLLRPGEANDLSATPRPG